MVYFYKPNLYLSHKHTTLCYTDQNLHTSLNTPKALLDAFPLRILSIRAALHYTSLRFDFSMFAKVPPTNYIETSVLVWTVTCHNAKGALEKRALLLDLQKLVFSNISVTILDTLTYARA